MKIIKAIIIEDEKDNSKLLCSLLEDFCEGVEVLAEARNIQEGVQAIQQHQPDLVFLDIAMPRESGLSLYKYFDNIDFEVVFTTAYNQYAIKAIKLEALDYLMKPINLEELMDMLARFRAKKSKTRATEKEPISETGLLKEEHPKIALPSSNGYFFVPIDDIIRCTSEKYYTLFVLKDGKDIWVSKNLGEYERILEPYGFKRVHRSHLINPKMVKQFIRGKRPSLIMEDDVSITIAASRKEDFLKDFVFSG